MSVSCLIVGHNFEYYEENGIKYRRCKKCGLTEFQSVRKKIVWIKKP